MDGWMRLTARQSTRLSCSSLSLSLASLQGVWSRVLPTPDGGIILKAGWLVEPDRAIVSRFDYTSQGRLEVRWESVQRYCSW